MQPLYPTRQPITTPNVADFIAFQNAKIAATIRAARVKLRVVMSPALIEKMADDMRRHGEGMTRSDLKALGYTESQIDACAEKANRRALELSRN